MNRSLESIQASIAEAASAADEKRAQADLMVHPEASKEGRKAACKRIMKLTIEMNKTNHV